MPRSLVLDDRRNLWRPRTGTVYCILAKMHSTYTDALGITPLYFTNNGEDITFEAQTWKSWYLVIEGPKQGDGFIASSNLTIGTVSQEQEVLQAIRATPLDLFLDWRVVRLAPGSPPTVAGTIIPTCQSVWRDVEIEGFSRATGRLETEERWSNEPFPWLSYTPATFPGLF